MEKRAGRPANGPPQPCIPKAYQLLGILIAAQPRVERLLGSKLHIAGNINITAQGSGAPNPRGGHREPMGARRLETLRSTAAKGVRTKSPNGSLLGPRHRRPEGAVEVAPINRWGNGSARGGPASDQRPKGMDRAKRDLPRPQKGSKAGVGEGRNQGRGSFAIGISRW